jgi:hypothetical protein
MPRLFSVAVGMERAETFFLQQGRLAQKLVG